MTDRTRAQQLYSLLVETLQGLMPAAPVPPGSEAKELIARAQAEARAAGYVCIGGEHLLAAVLAQPRSLAGLVLAQVEHELQAQIDRLSTAQRRRLPRSLGAPRLAIAAQLAQLRPAPMAQGVLPASAVLPYTRRAHAALRLAEEDARGRHHARLDSLHVLVGLLREGDGLAAQILEAAGISVQAVEAAERALKVQRPAAR